MRNQGLDKDTVGRFHVSTLRIAIVVALVGWSVMAVGFLAHIPTLITVGSCMFVAFVAVWGLSNGGVLLWAIRATGRGIGWKRFLRDCRQHPWSTGVYGLLTVFLLWVGLFVAAALVKQGLR